MELNKWIGKFPIHSPNPLKTLKTMIINRNHLAKTLNMQRLTPELELITLLANRALETSSDDPSKILEYYKPHFQDVTEPEKLLPLFIDEDTLEGIPDYLSHADLFLDDMLDQEKVLNTLLNIFPSQSPATKYLITIQVELTQLQEVSWKLEFSGDAHRDEVYNQVNLIRKLNPKDLDYSYKFNPPPRDYYFITFKTS